MRQRSPLTPILSLAALLLAGGLAPQARASGFQLREQSASSLGNAFAGATAGAQDITSMYWNPATMALFDGRQASIGGSWVGVRMDLGQAAGTRAPNFEPGTDRTISGPSSLPNAVSQPVLPNLSGTWALNARVTLGLSVNVPFGMVTNYPDTFLGRYHGLRTDLKIIDVAPAIAFKANPAWSFGAALVARKATATITEAVDFGAIGSINGVPGLHPGAQDGLASLTGDCWAYGYKVGFTFQPDPVFRLGVGYQGATTLKVDGQVSYQNVPTLLGSFFPNGGGKADLKLPATASAGFDYHLTDTFSVQGEWAWTGWSTFKELRVRFASGQADSVTDESWRSTKYTSLGCTWKLSPVWTLRAGLAYDQSPVDDLHRTPRIPDGDRTWYSVGAAWAASATTVVDFGYTRIQAKDSTLNLRTGSDPAGDNFYRGNVDGSYKINANMVALSVRLRM